MIARWSGKRNEFEPDGSYHRPTPRAIRFLRRILISEKPVGTVEGVWTLCADGKWRDKNGHIQCEHGRHRFSCKDCGGSQFCEHGRPRHRCKDCGGVSVLYVYKRSAYNRGYAWELTDEQAWHVMRQPCVYCGSDTKVNGIDRDKNAYGYTTLNSMPCCSKCNFMKHSNTTEEFINHVQKIAAHTATYEQFKQRRDEIWSQSTTLSNSLTQGA